MKTKRDKFGRQWPNLLPNELCSVCGQPDLNKDCKHRKLTKKLVAVYSTFGIWRDKKIVKEVLGKDYPE